MPQCPSCKSQSITLYMGFSFGKYFCKQCGYIGPMLLEKGKRRKNEHSLSPFPAFLLFLFVLNLGFLLLAYAFFDTAFGELFYQEEFQKYSSAEREIRFAQHQSILSYLKGEADSAKLSFLNEREITHMADVKGVLQQYYQYFLYAFLTMLIFGFCLYHRMKNCFIPALQRCLRRTGLLLIGFVLLLGILFLLNFSNTFNAFHYLFFHPGSWQFPAESVLLQIYPEFFFVDIVMVVLQKTIILGILLWLLGKTKSINSSYT